MIPEGLRVSLNAIRETAVQDNQVYAQYVEEILPSTDIGSWAKPILEFPKVMNEFIPALVQQISYIQIEKRLFRNPLAILDGDEIPLGSIGEEIYVNPVIGRRFNVDDFAGLLAKYSADVKTQYHQLNSDIQYPLTITRAKIKDAFRSWEELESFINANTNALYNGAYIDRYNMTKDLIACAYKGNNVQVEVVSAISSEATAKAFIKNIRTKFLNFQTPTDKYNAWAKVGGYGNAIVTWTPKEDIVILIRNDVLSEVNVDVLATSFNMEKADLLGRIIGVNDFDVYENVKESDGKVYKNKIFDGSKIICMIADRRWFRIRNVELEMDDFYNPNNRTWTFYLNDVRGYDYSLFCNAVVYATELPDVKATGIEFLGESSFELEKGAKKVVRVALTPTNATSSTTFTSGDATVVKATKISDTEVELEGVDDSVTPVTITASNNSNTDTISVTCVDE
jgi:hypothetical protein